MPWVSDAQRRWGNSPSGIKAMGQAKVNEFNKATEGKKLVKRKKKGGSYDSKAVAIAKSMKK